MTSTRPHEGVSYRGQIKNEDYGFTATVPAGQTGWSGVDPSAPFHGFTIFLDPARRSCVVFEVHIRVVDDADVPQPPNGATAVSLGKAKGWRALSSKVSGNSKLNNVTTSFSVLNEGDTNDGTIILVSPDSEMKRNQQLYDSFVKSLRFGSK